MKVFHCDHCGQLLFFENINCVRCGRVLAFVPELMHLVSLDRRLPDQGANAWWSPSSATGFRLCENYLKYDVCNWALRENDPNVLCRGCQLTQTIPNLTKEGNRQLWYKLEVAKRRLLYTFEQLGLPFHSRREEPETGLAFEFLEDALTGHKEGMITVNIAEADDAERVKRRNELNEPYRTLLGHFRHESGHYFWDRLIANGPHLASFRQLFGDERADYAAAIQRNYNQGAPFGWQDSYVSAYAAMHPWEDWAETWAHYLHMIDTLETASANGISLEPPRRDEPTIREVPNPVTEDHVAFDRLLSSWTPITYMLNNLNRGLGFDDAYPFVLSDASVRKLRFIHDTIAARSVRFTQPPAQR